MESFAEALRARGASIDGNDRASLEAGFDTYVRACDDRRQQAAGASRRRDLNARLRDRERAEASVAETRTQIAAARASLLDAAHQCGVDASSEADMVEELERWLARRSERLARDEQRRSQ